MKNAEEEWPRKINNRATTTAIDDLLRQLAIHLSRDVAGRASDPKNGVRPFTHSQQVIRGPFGARKMEVRELGDRVSGAFINRTGNFTPLNMSDADVHICRRDGGGERLVAVADQQHNLGFEALELAGKFDHAEADRLCHCGRRGTFQFDVNLPVNWETVRSDDLHRLVKAFQHHGAGSQDLELQVRMCGNRLHHGLEAAIVGAIHQDDAYFSPVVVIVHHKAKSFSVIKASAWTAWASLRPMIS